MANKLMAGASKVCVTPTPDYFPMFNKPNGIAGGADSIFGRAHDDIFVRALVLDNGKNRIVIFSTDNGSLRSLTDDGGLFIDIIAKTANVPFSNVLACGTHNHNGFTPANGVRRKAIDPELYEKCVRYEEVLEKAIEQVTKEAVANLRPAKIGYGTSECYANANRHCYSETGLPSIAGFELDKPSDKELIVLNVLGEDDTPLAVVYNYAAHASLLANNKPDGEFTELSGDWPGYVSRKLEDHYGNGFVALHLPGAGGDQNTVMMSRVYKVLPDGKGTMFDFGPAAYIVLDFVSDMVYTSTLKAIDNVPQYKDHAKIWAAKRRHKIDEEYFKFDDGQFTTIGYSMADPEFQYTLVMLGDIALAANNGEIYTSIGMRLKQDSPYKKTMYITHAGRGLGYFKDVSGHGLAELDIRKNLYELMDEYSYGE